MTHGDKIRASTDEELAAMIMALLRSQRMQILSQLQKFGLNINVVEMPLFSQAAILKMLREQVEERESYDPHNH